MVSFRIDITLLNDLDAWLGAQSMDIDRTAFIEYAIRDALERKGSKSDSSGNSSKRGSRAIEGVE